LLAISYRRFAIGPTVAVLLGALVFAGAGGNLAAD